MTFCASDAADRTARRQSSRSGGEVSPTTAWASAAAWGEGVDGEKVGVRVISSQTAVGTMISPYRRRSRSNCLSAARQISGEASLTTTAMLEILGELLRAVMHGDLALREYAVHFRARQTGKLRGLAQAENALGVKRHGELQAQPLYLFPVRQAKRIGHVARDFKRQGLRNAARRSRGAAYVQVRQELACRRLRGDRLGRQAGSSRSESRNLRSEQN